MDGVVSETIILYKFNETLKIRCHRLLLCNFIKTQKVRYGWCVTRTTILEFQ